MSYNNPPGRFSSTLSPGAGHYGSPAHGQHGSYPGSQPWSPQQHQQQPPEYASAVLSSSPSGTPSPAHTPPASMSGGQFPGHRHAQASAWAQAQGMGMHPGGGMGVASSQAPGYYPAPHPSLVGTTRAMQGPPQHAHMSSDRHSPGAWNNLGMPPTAKSPGGLESGRAPAPGTPAGPGNPLFNLQMLVNQDINRGAAQGNSYRTMAAPQQQESVDLSSASGEGYSRLLQQAGPIALTRTDKQTFDHSSVRNGNIITSNVTPPPTPLNGEVSSDGSAEPSSGALSLAAKDSSKETVVSVIAQTPPRERLKAAPVTVSSTVPSQWTAGEPSQMVSAEDSKALVSEKPETSEASSISAASEEVSIVAITSTVKQPEASASSSSPSPCSPVCSPKSGSFKRAKKVDSIVETLVESSTKKLSVSNETVEQSAVVPVTASVIVSPAVVSEDSGGVPSPGRLSAAREDDVVSPSFSDDTDNGKPRRKRKLDKPVRLSKTSSDGESEKPDEDAGDCVTKSSYKVEEAGEDIEEIEEIEEVDEIVEIQVIPRTEECKETPEDEVNVKDPGEESEENEKEAEGKGDEDVDEEDEEEKEDDGDEEHSEERSLPTTADPVSARGMDSVPKNLLPSEKVEMVRRRRSSESSSLPAHQSPSISVQKTRRKSESDQQDDTAGGLSALAQEQNRGSGESKFIEVETELEKMFAGIEEDTKMDTEEDPLKLDSGSPVLMDVIPEAKAIDSSVEPNAVSSDKLPPANLKRVRSRTPKRGSRRFSETLISSVSSADSTPQKKKRKQQKTPSDESFSAAHAKKRKQTRLFQGIVKEATGGYESNATMGRYRGPVVHVDGPKDNPYRVMVINAPSRLEDEDGGDKKQSLSGGRRKKTSLHNDLEYRGKVPRTNPGGLGMFSSTLSARYDSQTADCSWICVFCKHGPHAGSLGLGDLFGPYLIARERTDCMGPFANCEVSVDDRDITEEQRRGSKNKRSLRAAQMLEQFQHRMSKKLKRSQVVEGDTAGLVSVSAAGGDECWEVWVHEECVVWAEGVYLVGSRIAGLQEAVWSAVRTVCNKCGQGGANVWCVQRGCEWRMHVACAKQYSWQLDQDLYVARCHQHKTRPSSPESILPT